MQTTHNNIQLEIERFNKMVNTCWVQILQTTDNFFINSVPLWYEAASSQKNKILSHAAICEHHPRYEQFQLKYYLMYIKKIKYWVGGQNH